MDLTKALLTYVVKNYIIRIDRLLSADLTGTHLNNVLGEVVQVCPHIIRVIAIRVYMWCINRNAILDRIIN